MYAMKRKSSMLCCPLCSYSTKFPSYLKRHCSVHTTVKAISCDVCGAKFKEACAYRLHVKEKHASGAHACQTCGLEFTHRRTLDRHILCHSAEKPIACAQCGYRCKRKQDLEQHIRCMHTGKPRRKRHEECLASFFLTLSIDFTRECVIKVDTFAGRRSARVDFVISMPFGYILFECDEFQHSAYSISNECQRMEALWGYHRLRYPDACLHIIRYNSHAYKEGGEIKKPTQQERAASIQECLAYVPADKFVITYLYYRTEHGRVAITTHPDYTLQQYVRPIASPREGLTQCDLNENVGNHV